MIKHNLDTSRKIIKNKLQISTLITELSPLAKRRKSYKTIEMHYSAEQLSAAPRFFNQATQQKLINF